MDDTILTDCSFDADTDEMFPLVEFEELLDFELLSDIDNFKGIDN